jgi:hypothetical protein
MYPIERKFKARVERAKKINKATALLIIATLGTLAGYCAAAIAKVAQ